MTAARSASSGIFISYRRQESGYVAAWLHQRLGERFGGHQVFTDVDTIEPGDDYVDVVSEAVGSCSVFLALIGPDWVSLTDADGARRLDDPVDLVRLEIEAALRRGIRVIPVLLSGASMPRPDELPASLVPLARRQAVDLAFARFDVDAQRLFEVIERTLESLATPPPPAPIEPMTVRPKPDSLEPEPSAPERSVAEPSVAAPSVADVPVTHQQVHQPEPPVPEPPVIEPPATRPTSAGQADAARWLAPVWLVAGLVLGGLVLVVVNRPNAERAWLQPGVGTAAGSTWHDAFIWAPLMAVVGALGVLATRRGQMSLPMLGVVTGAAAYSLGTATIVVTARWTDDKSPGEPWVATGLVAIAVLVCVWLALRPDRGGWNRPSLWPAVLTLAGVAVTAASQFVPGIPTPYNQMYKMTQLLGNDKQVDLPDLALLPRPLIMLAMAALVVLRVGGSSLMAHHLAACATYLALGVVDAVGTRYLNEWTVVALPHAPRLITVTLIGLAIFAAGILAASGAVTRWRV